MIVRFIFLLLILQVKNNLYAQNNTNCELFIALLNHEKAKKVFYFDNHSGTPIVFVDVLNKLGNCNLEKYNDRDVFLVHDTAYLNVSNYSNLLITLQAKSKKRIKVSAYYKIRNAIFQITYKKRNGKFVITKFEGGYY